MPYFFSVSWACVVGLLDRCFIIRIFFLHGATYKGKNNIFVESKFFNSLTTINRRHNFRLQIFKKCYVQAIILRIQRLECKQCISR